MRTITALATAGALLALAACSDDDNGSSESTAATTATTAAADTGDDSNGGDAGGDMADDTADAMTVVAGEPFPEARCAANEAAGTVTFLTGFDYAATASIVDVIVAQEAGYYDELCLDVEIVPSFSTANYPLIAENEAQFASGGSFSEVVAFAEANDADFVVVAVEGRTPIDSLIVKPGEAADLASLEGTTIGVKGKLPPSIAAMLSAEGLVEGENFDTVLLDGFDPTAHIAIDSIVGFPGWQSNEPGALERNDIDFELFTPQDFDVPGSFGAIYTNQQFVDEHPTAAEDFVRATMRGLDDALTDPEGAATTALALIEAGGNPNFLSTEGEIFRWTTDAALIVDTTPDGTGVGVPDTDALQAELDAYAAVGLFGDGDAPDAASSLGDVIIVGIYDDTGTVIWPA